MAGGGGLRIRGWSQAACAREGFAREGEDGVPLSRIPSHSSSLSLSHTLVLSLSRFLTPSLAHFQPLSNAREHSGFEAVWKLEQTASRSPYAPRRGSRVLLGRSR